MTLDSVSPIYNGISEKECREYTLLSRGPLCTAWRTQPWIWPPTLRSSCLPLMKGRIQTHSGGFSPAPDTQVPQGILLPQPPGRHPPPQLEPWFAPIY